LNAARHVAGSGIFGGMAELVGFALGNVTHSVSTLDLARLAKSLEVAPAAAPLTNPARFASPSVAKTTAGNSFAQLEPAARASIIQSIEAESSRRVEPARTYWRLKGLVIHGYFTSEPVMKDVLKVEVMPGRFEGAAPMPVRTSTPPGGGEHRHA